MSPIELKYSGFRLKFRQYGWLRVIEYVAEDSKVFEIWNTASGYPTLHKFEMMHINEARIALDIMENFDIIWN